MTQHSASRSSDAITTKLDELRGMIQRYLLMTGGAVLVIFLCVAFWASFGLDVLNFSYRKLDLPWQLRLTITLGILVGLGYLLFTFLIRPLLRQLEDRTLALLVERKYPELNDRLVTAVDVSDEELNEQPAQQMMFQQTRQEAGRMLSGFEMKSLLNQQRLSRLWTVSGMLLTSLILLACFNQPAFARWTRGFVMLKPEYWERFTSLTINVLAAPGDRKLEFVDRVYKHPRGEDFTLIVHVDSSQLPVEQIVVLTQNADKTSSGRLRMSKVNETTFRLTMANVVDDFKLWLVGGDYRNSVPFRVTMVETPEFDELLVQARYPEYTQLNLGPETTREELPILGPTLELPLGTEFDFQARANKPLVKMELRTERLELELTPQTLTYSYKPTEADMPISGVIASDAFDWNDDHTRFSFPAMLITDTLLPSVTSQQVPVPADQLVRIYLHDEDGVITREPIKVQFLGNVDQPPRIETELYGISTQVTRKARIPFRGQLKDDYGLANAWFDATLPGLPEGEKDEVSQVQQKRFELQTPPDGQREFRLKRTDFDETEVFELLPLDLNLGAQFTLAIAAEDGNTLTGPQISTGQRYQFRIVTAEELLSGLHRRELNLRSRFEQILSEVKASRGLIEELGNAPVEDLKQENCERALYANRKNDSELQAIEAGFQAIRLETVNNAVDSPEVLNRLDQSILSPLGTLLTQHFPQLDRLLQGPAVELPIVLAEYDATLRLMEQILLEMRKLETFNEAIEMLKGIIDEQKEVKEQTEEKRKKELLDLFDGF